jgi:L-lysine 6-transaminase
MARTVFDINIDFKKSKGSYVFDKRTNKPFLDLFSMFSSLPLGYNHSVFDASFDQKIKHITHLRMSNNLFHSDELEDFEKNFLNISFHNNLHFCSTGALAVEAALKCGYEYKKNSKAIVLGVKNSFHGINSWGFVTDSEISSVKNRVANYPKNNWELHPLDVLIEKLENITQSISSVIIEPIQCTAGDIYLDVDKLKKIQGLCNKNDICFIVDEIQTGFGATGEIWYSRKIGLNPDIIIFGKKSQICGIMTNDKYSEAIHSKYRKLEVTFDGDLIDAVRAEYTIKAIKEYFLLENVNNKSSILRNELSESFDNYRSSGFLVAFDFKNRQKRDRFVSNAYAHKLLVNPTNERSVRIRPNLAFSDNELDELFSKINSARNK